MRKNHDEILVSCCIKIIIPSSTQLTIEGCCYMSFTTFCYDPMLWNRFVVLFLLYLSLRVETSCENQVRKLYQLTHFTEQLPLDAPSAAQCTGEESRVMFVDRCVRFPVVTMRRRKVKLEFASASEAELRMRVESTKHKLFRLENSTRIKPYDNAMPSCTRNAPPCRAWLRSVL